MNKVRALSCEIFVNNSLGDCSNNGISNRFDMVYALCPDGNVEIDLDNPPENLVVFESRDFGTGEYFRFNPYNTNGKWNMFGGAFVWDSDARFSERFSKYPVPLHDRYE